MASFSIIIGKWDKNTPQTNCPVKKKSRVFHGTFYLLGFPIQARTQFKLYWAFILFFLSNYSREYFPDGIRTLEKQLPVD